jgi:hypothetical protein
MNNGCGHCDWYNSNEGRCWHYSTTEKYFNPVSGVYYVGGVINAYPSVRNRDGKCQEYEARETLGEVLCAIGKWLWSIPSAPFKYFASRKRRSQGWLCEIDMDEAVPENGGKI